MDHFSELIKFNLQNNNHLKKFCEPIYHHFNVKHFWYYSITPDGHYTCLGSHMGWTEYYFSEKLYIHNPFFRSPDNFSTGIHFIRKEENQSYHQSIDAGNKQFNLNLSLLLLEKNKNGVQGYGFASSSHVKYFEELCMNELPLLKLFIERFKENFGSQIRKIEEEPVNISTLIGPSFYKNQTTSSSLIINKNDFLKDLKFPNVNLLSKREISVLEYVCKGYSASQIASHLFLSKRTIEHYIDNIKNKLNCYSKLELMQFAQELSHLGYFLP